MAKNLFVSLSLLTCIFALSAAAQNRFDGYALEVSADRAGNGGACPVRFLDARNEGRSVQVFLAGTGLKTPATDIKACGASTITGNKVSPGPDSKWCFEGPEELYELGFSNGESYLWPMLGRETGFYNIKDFRPVRRVEGTPAKYVYSEPRDYTKAFKNAMVLMASRQGGTLNVPDGDYVVGTTDGNTRDPKYDAITIPSGVTITGSAGHFSIPGTNTLEKVSAARIRLRHPNQTIFRIGGCTNSVTLRNIELLGNSALFSEAKRDRKGTIGVEAVGKFSIDPVSKAMTAHSSMYFRFEGVKFQEFDTGILVENANRDKCNAAEQLCSSWQFDFVNVDQCAFLNNRTGISIDTFNTDWKVSSSFFSYVAAEAPGYGIRLIRGGAFLLQNSFGGGYDYGALIGGTFLYIDGYDTVTVINSSSERSQRSIFAAGYGAVSGMTLALVGNIFSDKIELGGRLNFVSTGNHYAGYTMSIAPDVTVNSVGDKFCQDPLIVSGYCNDAAVNGKPVNSPGFNGGRVMFRSGRLPEGTGRERIDRQPNFFGYDVEINKGVLQHDPDTTFADLAKLAAPADTGTRVKDGAMVYCKDCKKAATGQCSQGQAGVDGAFAKRINGQWRCD